MMQRQSARMHGIAQMRRSNMPVPARRMPGMMPVRPRQPDRAFTRPAALPDLQWRWRHGHGPWHGWPGGMGGGWAGADGLRAAGGAGRGPSYDNPQMPGYAWPSYASYPNYAALTLSAAVLADGLAVHRSVLSLSASAAGMAEGVAGMGRRLVVPRLQRAQLEPLGSSSDGSTSDLRSARLRHRAPAATQFAAGVLLARVTAICSASAAMQRPFSVITGKTRKFSPV